ncbi:MAG: serine hydrolase [Desulfobacterales bacterium]|nr:MAG: serine hydrolase [Desulfobacterales bacterium]
MQPWIKKTLLALGVVLLGGLIAAGWYLSNTLPIGTGHVAKTICSNAFIAQRPPAAVFEEDIAPVHFLFAITGYDLDERQKSVTATSFGFARTKAIFREGCGCTVVKGTTEAELRRQTFMQVPQQQADAASKTDAPWPAGDQRPPDPLPAGVDVKRLNAALEAAFAEPAADHPRKTRAVVVVYAGKLIAERYAPGVSPTMPLLGWSMSKSVTNALVGVLVRQGKLHISRPAPVPAWQKEGDPRRTITIDQLLRMSSGLEFDETYAPFADAVSMFYASYDFAAYASQKPLEAKPDTTWHYSSGTANIIARIVRRAAEEEYRSYYTFIHRELFDRIGMHSAVFEPDPSGTFVGSSYVFATARDWARFGLLYLQDGVWEGERLLPEGWVTYSTTPTPPAPRGEYGALFWLNAGSASNPANRRWPSIPRDAYSAEGFQEQRVIIIPSRKLVLVRLGHCARRDAWDDEKFIADVLAALPAN